jgi:hypothetical protein
MTTTTIMNDQDIIDSRDIIDRIDELEDELEGLGSEGDCEKQGLLDEWQELKALKELSDQGQSESSDWIHGETLIRRSYFVDYTEELINDCYEMPKQMHSGDWPFRHMTIDYEAAAKELEQDYSSIDFDGVEYLIRSC